MKICIITPWPPQISGIADYSVSLAKTLVEMGHTVDIYTNADSPTQHPGISVFTLQRAEDLVEIAAFHDATIVQLGNHGWFHGYMVDFIVRCSDRVTVILHDFVLSHLFHLDEKFQPNDDHLTNIVSANYSRTVGESLAKHLKCDDNILSWPHWLEFPLSIELLRKVRSIVVHSEYVRGLFFRQNIKRVHLVPFPPFACGSLAKRNRSHSSDRLYVGILGGIQKNRKVAQTLRAFSRVNSTLGWQIDVVGQIDEDCAHLQELSASLGIQDRVIFHGRVPEDELELMLSRLDLHIALREPTLGETSGMVMRGLRYGIPTVVNNVGWYAELPDAVCKVEPGEREIDDIFNYVKKFFDDKAFRDKTRDELLSFAKSSFDTAASARAILEAAQHS